jgi:hypothetical protein
MDDIITYVAEELSLALDLRGLLAFACVSHVHSRTISRGMPQYLAAMSQREESIPAGWGYTHIVQWVLPDDRRHGLYSYERYSDPHVISCIRTYYRGMRHGATYSHHSKDYNVKRKHGFFIHGRGATITYYLGHHRMDSACVHYYENDKRRGVAVSIDAVHIEFAPASETKITLRRNRMGMAEDQYKFHALMMALPPEQCKLVSQAMLAIPTITLLVMSDASNTSDTSDTSDTSRTSGTSDSDDLPAGPIPTPLSTS